MKREFDKAKAQKAVRAVERICLHCDDHDDGCPVNKATEALKEIL
jgi:hypothetical protein